VAEESGWIRHVSLMAVKIHNSKRKLMLYCSAWTNSRLHIFLKAKTKHFYFLYRGLFELCTLGSGKTEEGKRKQLKKQRVIECIFLLCIYFVSWWRKGRRTFILPTKSHNDTQNIFSLVCSTQSCVLCIIQQNISGFDVVWRQTPRLVHSTCSLLSTLMSRTTGVVIPGLCYELLFHHPGGKTQEKAGNIYRNFRESIRRKILNILL